MVKDLKIDVIIPNKKGCYDNTHVIVQGFVKFQARIMTMEGAEAINVGIASWIVMGRHRVFSKSAWHAHIDLLGFSKKIRRR